MTMSGFLVLRTYQKRHSIKLLTDFTRQQRRHRNSRQSHSRAAGCCRIENFSIAALICEANERYSCTWEARCSFVANFIRRDLMENLFCNSLAGGNPVNRAQLLDSRLCGNDVKVTFLRCYLENFRECVTSVIN